jgi:hypothetical protein
MHKDKDCHSWLNLAIHQRRGQLKLIIDTKNANVKSDDVKEFPEVHGALIGR